MPRSFSVAARLIEAIISAAEKLLELEGRPGSRRLEGRGRRSLAYFLSCVMRNATMIVSVTRGLIMMMPTPRAACENDVSPDRKPESVVADKRNLNEYPDDRKDHQYERKHKSKVHYASPLRCVHHPRRITLSRREAFRCSHLDRMGGRGRAVAA